MKTFLKAFIFIMISAASLTIHAENYNPLQSFATAQIIDLSVQDNTRNREIPIRVYLPETKSPAPVIFFSHGLGGSNKAGSYLGKHWSGRGYVVVALQHPGSDESIWKGKGLSNFQQSMGQAMDLKNFMLRVKDVPAALRQLKIWNQTAGHPFYGRLETSIVGMSGHSYGAVTTQAVSGQSSPLGRPKALTLPEIKAAVILSPSSPRRGSPERAFGSVDIPWLLMTGSKDIGKMGGASLESRLAVYPALPPGDKYELFLDDAEHSAFADEREGRTSSNRNPNHHKAILALSTAFWDGYLLNNPDALAWLKGVGPATILESKDRWQKK
jgi:predicted dienelactone hydrolase